jgi:hypothetical protein
MAQGHISLSETGTSSYLRLCGLIISKHHDTKVSPFELVYGQEALLPVGIRLNTIRFARQNDIIVGDYHDLMMDNIDEVTNKRMMALREIERYKVIVAKAYNKKVKVKSFQMRDLVW